jgi:ABC-type transport system involved in multi-copper enzyme maturation permease subunit
VTLESEAITIDVAAKEPAEPQATAGARAWAAFERQLVRLGDRLNPILVKETRQALKSRQFVVTFALLLLCGWFWSIGGVAMIGPEIQYSASGPSMFYGYYLILSFPLLVIVPFGAFRSLAAEQEERTYEMLSITTLGPRQIVAGKLGSAALQMIIYLSAISPCLAFTYMLRGIDFPTILMVLCYTVLASLGLSVIGLFLGTLTSEKHLQVILTVIVVIGLLLAFWAGCALAYAILDYSMFEFNDIYFWLGNAAFLTGYASYFALVFYAAAARLTFASDNRSTRLRAIMLAQHVLCVAWMSWIWVTERGQWEIILALMVMVGIHWYVMGAMMVGESPDLSERVKRQLPQSFLGRVFLTWFNPGPGTGYLFALAGLFGTLALAAPAAIVHGAFPEWARNSWISGRSGVSIVLAFGVLGVAYVTSFLGVGFLLIRLARKLSRVGILSSLLIQAMLLTIACAVPAIIQMTSPKLRNADYTLLQITNPFWTLLHVAGRRALPPDTPVLLLLVSAAALLVFLLNLPGVARELSRVRIAKPERVAEEDAQLAPVPIRPARTSPWDD